MNNNLFNFLISISFSFGVSTYTYLFMYNILRLRSDADTLYYGFFVLLSFILGLLIGNFLKYKKLMLLISLPGLLLFIFYFMLFFYNLIYFFFTGESL